MFVVLYDWFHFQYKSVQENSISIEIKIVGFKLCNFILLDDSCNVRATYVISLHSGSTCCIAAKFYCPVESFAAFPFAGNLWFIPGLSPNIITDPWQMKDESMQ